MIVNLPNWTTVTNGVEPWVSGILNSFAPAVYWEIGLAVGVGVILFVWAVIGGGFRSLLGAFGHGSDPMRGISGGNSGVAPMRGSFGGIRSGGSMGRTGSVGGMNIAGTSNKIARWKRGKIKEQEKEDEMTRKIRRNAYRREANLESRGSYAKLGNKDYNDAS